MTHKIGDKVMVEVTNVYGVDTYCSGVIKRHEGELMVYVKEINTGIEVENAYDVSAQFLPLTEIID